MPADLNFAAACGKLTMTLLIARRRLHAARQSKSLDAAIADVLDVLDCGLADAAEIERGNNDDSKDDEKSDETTDAQNET